MIRCYMGLLGSGKTYSMVADAMLHLRKNRSMVFSNMAGLCFPEAVYYGNVTGLLDLRSGLVLFDEVGVALNSRFWADVPRDIISRFSQARKHGLDLFYTAQYQEQADRTLRDVTNEFIQCKKWAGRLTKSTVLPGQTETEARKTWRSFHAYRPEVFAVYDTLEVISTSGGSQGRADFAAPVSLAARMRSAASEGNGGAKKDRHAPLTANIFGVEVASPSARQAMDWLRERGRLDCSDPAVEVLRRELIRRHWLSLFGLTWEDVPDSCAPWNPWLEGYDPATVMQREYIASLELEAEKYALKASSRGRKLAGAD